MTMSDASECALRVQLVEPVVCRSSGLPFSRLEDFGAGASREALWALLDDGEFVDCLVTMHHAALPSLYSRRAKFNAQRRPSNERRAELTLYRYLTRFCSRNDTTGTAGTTIWGTLGEQTALVPAAEGGKTRTVFASPRHAELLWHRAAHGPLRARAQLLLSACYRWTGSSLEDPYAGGVVELSPHEMDVVRQAEETVIRLGELNAPQQEVAAQLVEREVLTLRLAGQQGPHRDSFRGLVEHARDSMLADDVERLVDLQRRLCCVREDEFARLMEEADEVAARLALCRSLSVTQVPR